MQTIAIIGGGAAGLMAAVSVLRHCEQCVGAMRVVLLEKNARVGKKLLVTGNGRCNLANTDGNISHYHSEEMNTVQSILDRFKLKDVIAFFEGLGLVCHITSEGLVYPRSMQAASVLDVLRFEAARLGVRTVCEFEAANIRKAGERYSIKAKSGEMISADQVIITTGSGASGGTDSALRLIKPLGHRAITPYAALTPLTTDLSAVKTAAGMRAAGWISLVIDGAMRRSEQGEIQFCDYGLSGIAVMQLSGMVSQYFVQGGRGRVEVVLDLMCEYAYDELLDMLMQRRKSLGHLTAENFLCGMVNKRVGMAALKAAGINLHQPVSELTGGEIEKIAAILKEWRIAVTGTRGPAQAQVCGGGLRLDEFDAVTLESVWSKGLYAAGEALDVYGDCGGYNLWWAWASGMAAGQAAAKEACRISSGA